MILVMAKRVSVWLSAAVLVLLAGTPRLEAQKPLHLVLTPSQKPTDLLATGQEFGTEIWPRSAWRRSGWRTWPGGAPTPCPAGSSNGWPSHARSPSARV
jgi:hypothetical protein